MISYVTVFVLIIYEYIDIYNYFLASYKNYIII